MKAILGDGFTLDFWVTRQDGLLFTEKEFIKIHDKVLDLLIEEGYSPGGGARFGMHDEIFDENGELKG